MIDWLDPLGLGAEKPRLIQVLDAELAATG